MNFTEVNGTALRYDLDGNGLSTLVLIHEMGGTLESWDLVTPELYAWVIGEFLDAVGA